MLVIYYLTYLGTGNQIATLYIWITSQWIFNKSCYIILTYV